MNKAELVGRVARDTRITKVLATRVVDSMLEQITRVLRKGDRATLVGFGTFTVVRRRARVGRNPQTGDAIEIPSRRVIRFASGNALRIVVR
jgi:DNA-binding protein HU-beta